MKNLYEILGVSPAASSEDIRWAYRSKVKEVHPDVGGSSAAFGEVVLAYEILIDEERRKHYDETGSAEESGKDLLQGGKLVVEGLLNDLIQRDDAKYFDVIALMCATVSRLVSEKNANIDTLEQRRLSLADLKDRFKPLSPLETYLHDLFETKIETVSKAIAAERLSIAHLNAASSLLKRYEFSRENRSSFHQPGSIDPTAFGRPFDPLLNTSDISSATKKP